MKIKTAFLTAAALFAGYTAVALDVYYVNGTSGSWDDGANYTGGKAPGAADMFWYNARRFSPSGNRPVTLSLDGKTHYLYRFYMDMDGGTAASVDPSPLTILGPGTLNIHAESGLYHQLSYGREVVFDHIDFVVTNHLDATTKGGGLMPSGKITVKGGRVEAVDNGSYISVSGDHGTLVLEDGADVTTRQFYMSPGSTVSVKDSLLAFAGYNGNDPDVVTSNLRIGANSSFLSLNTTARYFTKGIIPSETNTLAVVNFHGYSAVQPPLEEGAFLPWRGTLVVTNSAASTSDTSPQTVFTNSVSIYGRGRLMACSLRFASEKISEVDLSRIDIGDNIRSYVYTNNATVNFRDTAIGLFNGNIGATSPGWAAHNIYLCFHGRTTFDFANPGDSAASVTRTDSQDCILFKDRSELKVTGAGVYNAAWSEMPRRFEMFDIGEDMTVNQRNSDYSVSASLRTRDFRMGPNSTYTSGQHNQEIEALGDVEIDPTAKIVHTPYNTSNNSCWSAFRSLAETPPTTNLTLTAMPDGYSLRWVGGSAFYANDVDITSGFTESYGYWLDGGPDCYFSTADNWGRKTLYKSGTINMTLSGKRHTVVTNDVDDVAVKTLIFGVGHDGYAGSAPFIVRGNPITVTSTNVLSIGANGKFSTLPAVFTASAFPHVMEARIDSVQDVMSVATAVESERRGALYFKGGINAPESRFVPMGSIVLGGEVTVRDFNPTNSIGSGTNTRFRSPYGKRNWTEVMLKPGCEMTVSAQTSVNHTDVMLAIMSNATMTVNGPWVWNETNTEHVVRGTLALNGTVGGDAVQGFFGRGTLQVKTTDGSAGGALRIGEGLTLVPTAADWGTLPLEVADTASVSNDLDVWTYAAADLAVLRPGRTLVFTGSGDTVIDAPVSAHDIVLRKEGTGALVLAAESDGLADSAVEIAEGSLGCTAPQSFKALRMAAGTRLVVDFSTDGGALVDVAGDVDIEGVKIVASGEDCAEWKEVLRVPAGSRITGTPVIGDRLRVKSETAADGSTVLKARLLRGLMMLVK